MTRDEVKALEAWLPGGKYEDMYFGLDRNVPTRFDGPPYPRTPFLRRLRNAVRAFITALRYG